MANPMPERRRLRLVPLRDRKADFEYVFFLLKAETSTLSPAENSFLLHML
ncbi:MAG: hypothetical protein LBS10_02610 [Gracilibacteraceae bacterium]|nr:hypothetical protein [Gracilibacteraceae bacterium]